MKDAKQDIHYIYPGGLFAQTLFPGKTFWSMANYIVIKNILSKMPKKLERHIWLRYMSTKYGELQFG